MKNKKIIVCVVVCLLIAGASFWGGMSYGKSTSNKNSFVNRQGSFNQNGIGAQGGRMMGQNIRGGNGGGFTSGEIISKDDKSMTIKLRDGGSKIVLFSDSSKFEKTVDGSISDIIAGKNVMVTGTTNPDGSISATSIQMRPEMQVPIKIN